MQDMLDGHDAIGLALINLTLLFYKSWGSDDEDGPFYSPVPRKKAIKVKHVKRRDKKLDKKV